MEPEIDHAVALWVPLVVRRARDAWRNLSAVEGGVHDLFCDLIGLVEGNILLLTERISTGWRPVA